MNLTKILAILKLIFTVFDLFKKDDSAGQENNDLRESKPVESEQYKENIHNETKTS